MSESAILTSLRQRPDFQRGDFAGTRRNTDYTSVVDTDLREVSRAQAQALRGAFGGPKPATGRAAAAVERVRAHRAAQAAPTAPVVTDPVAAKVAEIAAQVRPGKDGKTPRVSFTVLNDMIAAIGEGYFGLERREASSAGNVTTFFRIKRTYKGGPVRIMQVLGGPGGWRYEPLGVTAQFHALRHIGADVEKAGLCFAEKTSCCRRCHSPLTNTVSSSRGYGPDCIKLI